MEYYRIGTVEGVDFTPINKQPGFGENVDQVVKSAFVHFSSHLFSTDKLYPHQRPQLSNDDFWSHLDNQIRNEDFWTHIDNGDSRKLQINSREYWICLKNKNPVQRSMMNIHQVVENARYLEKTIEEQASTIKKLEEKVEAIRQVVYQMLGGLYNHETQSGTLNDYCDVLFAEKPKSYENNTSIWTQYPTTRQGDSNEERIEKLEQQLNSMLQDDDTCSTHSSMPGLIQAFD
jgi:chaperonin cofactor prefoldin